MFYTGIMLEFLREREERYRILIKRIVQDASIRKEGKDIITQ